MLKKKEAQGLSVNIVVVVVIGLLVLVVLIGILSEKLGFYSSSVRELTTCESTCKNIGYSSGRSTTESSCINDVKGNVIPGKFSDVGAAASDNVKLKDEERKCCCINK